MFIAYLDFYLLNYVAAEFYAIIGMNVINTPSFFMEKILDIAKNSTNGAPDKSDIYNFLYPSKDLLPDDKEMSVFDHLEELRQRIFVSVLAVGAAIIGCFAFSKDLILLLEAPVKEQGVRFLQLGPGEFFFTTLKVRTSYDEI